MATLHDVATRAKVSHTAVSSVINNIPGRVSEATRQRILEAVRELNYKPNRVARQLVSGKSDTILICFQTNDEADFLSPDANQLSAGIWKCAAENGLSLQFAPVVIPGGDFCGAISSIPSTSVDGAIIQGPIPREQKIFNAIENSTTPIVCIDSYNNYRHTSTVDSDNIRGMAMGTDYLISQGHQRLVYFGPIPLFQHETDRLSGFSETIHRRNIPVNNQTMNLIPLDSVDYTLRTMMESSSSPTAIVCSDYQYSVAVWDTLANMGIKVPDDVSVLAFDAMPPGHIGSEFVITVKLSFFDMGKASMQLLKDLIDGEYKSPANIRLLPELIDPRNPDRKK